MTKDTLIFSDSDQDSASASPVPAPRKKKGKRLDQTREGLQATSNEAGLETQGACCSSGEEINVKGDVFCDALEVVSGEVSTSSDESSADDGLSKPKIADDKNMQRLRLDDNMTKGLTIEEIDAQMTAVSFQTF